MKQLTAVVAFLCLTVSAQAGDRSNEAIANPDGFGFISDISLSLHFRAPKDKSLPVETGTIQVFELNRANYNIGWPQRVHLLMAEDGSGNLEPHFNPDKPNEFQNGFRSGGGELRPGKNIDSLTLEALTILDEELPNTVGTQLVVGGSKDFDRGLGFFAVTPKGETPSVAVNAPIVAPMDTQGLNYSKLLFSVLPRLMEGVEGAMDFNKQALKERYPLGQVITDVVLPNPETTSMACETQNIREETEIRCTIMTRLYGSVFLDPQSTEKH